MNLPIRILWSMLSAGVLLLAGCASPGGYGAPGGYGGYPGDYGPPSSGYPSNAGEILGTVDRVDTGYGRILLTVDDPRTGRSDRADVGYDRRTRLFYQGEQYPVEGLERGDVIRVQLADTGRERWAQTIEVVHNIRDSGQGGYYGGGYDGAQGQEFRGEVAYVDARARLVRLDRGRQGNEVRLAYDGRTTVEYQGRSYRPEDMERGDLVRIQARRIGNNDWLAERIIVERSARR